MDKTYICECCGKSYTRHLASEIYLRGNCYDCSFWLCKMKYPDYMAKRRAINLPASYAALIQNQSVLYLILHLYLPIQHLICTALNPIVSLVAVLQPFRPLSM